MTQRIFISHASIDAQIGEKLLDALVELGINKNDVFYSSKYHTGVKLGNDFNQTVKTALDNAEIVILLLTRSFYISPYCLNEMGATWIKDIPVIPILLDGLTYENMVGFIDSRHIAFTPDIKQSYKLLSSLKDYIEAPTGADAEVVFTDFVSFANEMAEKNAKRLPAVTTHTTNTEKIILEKRLTDGEVLLLDYFRTIETNEIDDSSYYNDIDSYESSTDIIKLEKYAVQFDLNYRNAMSLLAKSHLASFRNNPDYHNYCVFELDIETYRDLLSLSDAAEEHIMRIKAKRGVVTNEKEQDNTIARQENHASPLIENLIMSPKFKEIEALIFQYMIDTTSFSLGDRWMAEGQIKSIKQWESEKELVEKLSKNYDAALRSLIFRKLVEPLSYTSYGNPREYKMKDELIEQLLNLSDKAENVLTTVIENNTCALPF